MSGHLIRLQKSRPIFFTHNHHQYILFNVQDLKMAEGRIVGYVPPEGSNERTKLLRLKVIAGHNLAKKDIFGASDPYTRIDLVTVEGDEVEDSVLTKTKKRTLNPKWEEEFIFRVSPEKHKLVFEVFDENRLTRDDFLGMVELPLSNIPKEADGRTVPHKYYILRPRSARSKVKGHLQLYHAYVADNSESDDEVDAPPGAHAEDGSRVPTRATEEDWEIVGASEAAATVTERSANEETASATGTAAGGTLPPGKSKTVSITSLVFSRKIFCRLGGTPRR